MRKWLLGATALMIGLAVSAVDAADAKSPTIDEVMKKVNNRRTGLLSGVDEAIKAGTIDWDDVQKKTKEMREHIDALGKNSPMKGSKESWEKLTKSWSENAKKLDDAAKKKDKSDATSAVKALRGACSSCHKAHKGA